MKKILFLVTKSEIGGAQKHVLLSAIKAKNDGFVVLLGGGDKGWLSGELEKRGVPTIIFSGLKRSFNPFSSLVFAWQLRGFIKREKISEIYFNSSNTILGTLGLLGLRDGPKTNFIVHGWSYLSPGFKKCFLVKFLFWISMKILLPLVDEIIFVCNYDKELGEKLRLIKRGQGKVIYNEVGKIDFLEKKQALFELKKRKEFPDNKKIIGTITRLEYAKNNEMLIEAVSRLPKEILDKIICLIVGSGPDEEKLRLHASRLKLQDKIFLLGDIPDASRYLKAFDAFVMTSRYEGLPYVLLEAISAGLPIIATRVGGIPEVLKGKGTLVEPNNIEELKNALDKFFR